MSQQDSSSTEAEHEIEAPLRLTITLHCGRNNICLECPDRENLLIFINRLRADHAICRAMVEAVDSSMPRHPDLQIRAAWAEDDEFAKRNVQYWIEIKMLQVENISLDPRDVPFTPPERYETARRQHDLPDGQISINHLPTSFPFINSNGQETDRLLAIV